MLRPPAHARALCLARTCLRWEECVVWEEGGWGPRGKRCGAFQKDRFLWEISPEKKVLSAEIRVRKYTYPAGNSYMGQQRVSGNRGGEVISGQWWGRGGHGHGTLMTAGACSL